MGPLKGQCHEIFDHLSDIFSFVCSYRAKVESFKQNKNGKKSRDTVPLSNKYDDVETESKQQIREKILCKSGKCIII